MSGGALNLGTTVGAVQAADTEPENAVIQMSVAFRVLFNVYPDGRDHLPYGRHFIYTHETQAFGGTSIQFRNTGQNTMEGGLQYYRGLVANVRLTDAQKGTWTHWVFTYDAVTNEQRFYYNGSLDASGVVGDRGPVISVGPFHMGECPYCGGVQPIDGKIADFRIYGRLLSENEIAALAAMPLP